VTVQSAEVTRALHPLRLQRRLLASANPLMAGTRSMADQTRAIRRPADPHNPFLTLERLWADTVEEGWNLVRDLRAMATE
jgi:hypothetical protein